MDTILYIAVSARRAKHIRATHWHNPRTVAQSAEYRHGQKVPAICSQSPGATRRCIWRVKKVVSVCSRIDIGPPKSKDARAKGPNSEHRRAEPAGGSNPYLQTKHGPNIDQLQTRSPSPNCQPLSVLRLSGQITGKMALSCKEN